MKHTETEAVAVLKSITCDRCRLKAEILEPEFYEFTSIAYKAGYGSIFGDGNIVELDLCQACVKEALGSWVRVREDEGRSEAPARLDLFDPARHGGEFPD